MVLSTQKCSSNWTCYVYSCYIMILPWSQLYLINKSHEHVVTPQVPSVKCLGSSSTMVSPSASLAVHGANFPAICTKVVGILDGHTKMIAQNFQPYMTFQYVSLFLILHRRWHSSPGACLLGEARHKHQAPSLPAGSISWHTLGG